MKAILPAVLRTSFGLLALSLALPLSAADAKKDIIEKPFTLTESGKPISNVEAGSVTVTGGDSKSVMVKVTREAENANDTEAAKLLEDYEVILSQDGNIIRADGKAPRSNSWGWNKPRLKVRFVIIVPRKTDAEIGVSGGSTKVEDLAGTISTKTAGGSISLRTVEGGKACASTSGGSIHITGGSGKFDLRTAGGSIKLEEGKGTVDARTSGRSISVQLSEVPKESMTLKSAGGGISLKLPANTSANLDASAAGGSVTCDLPVIV